MSERNSGMSKPRVELEAFLVRFVRVTNGEGRGVGGRGGGRGRGRAYMLVLLSSNETVFLFYINGRYHRGRQAGRQVVQILERTISRWFSLSFREILLIADASSAYALRLLRAGVNF